MSETLSDAARRAIEHFNFSYSNAQIPDNFLRVYEEQSNVVVKGDLHIANEAAAAKVCKTWGTQIAKHYGNDFSVSVAVKGKVGLFGMNFYSQNQ